VNTKGFRDWDGGWGWVDRVKKRELVCVIGCVCVWVRVRVMVRAGSVKESCVGGAKPPTLLESAMRIMHVIIVCI